MWKIHIIFLWHDMVSNINHEFIKLKVCSCVKACVVWWGLDFLWEFYENHYFLLTFFLHFPSIYLPRCAYLHHRDHRVGKSSFFWTTRVWAAVVRNLDTRGCSRGLYRPGSCSSREKSHFVLDRGREWAWWVWNWLSDRWAINPLPFFSYSTLDSHLFEKRNLSYIARITSYYSSSSTYLIFSSCLHILKLFFSKHCNFTRTYLKSHGLISHSTKYNPIYLLRCVCMYVPTYLNTFPSLAKTNNEHWSSWLLLSLLVQLVIRKNQRDLPSASAVQLVINIRNQKA